MRRPRQRYPDLWELTRAPALVEFRKKLTAGIIFGMMSYALASRVFSQPRDNLISSSSMVYDPDGTGGTFDSQSIKDFK